MKKANWWLITPLIVGAWSLTFLLYCFVEEKNRGPFGDMFGAVNALFSGFAFAGLIITIRQQREDLKLQSNELKETKEEFRNQNFQTTFFNLLRTQREIINEFSLSLFFLNTKGVIDSREIKGRAVFRELKQELQKISEALNLESYKKYDELSIEHHINMFGDIASQDRWEEFSDYIRKEEKYYILHYYDIDESKFKEFKKFGDEQIIEKLKFIYERFFRKNEYALGHYFRHFYRLLKFLEKSEQEALDGIVDDAGKVSKRIQISNEFLDYLEFIKAQVDTPELVLLFYNSMNYEKAKDLFVRYKIFDVLYVGNLIKKEHDVIPQYNLKK